MTAQQQPLTAEERTEVLEWAKDVQFCDDRTCPSSHTPTEHLAARLVLEQEAEIASLRADLRELREDFGKCADLALMASSYWPELPDSWTGTVSERLSLTLGKEHEARMDAEAKLVAVAADHHRNWPDCPQCTKSANDDLAGAALNEGLRASLAECEKQRDDAHVRAFQDQDEASHVNAQLVKRALAAEARVKRSGEQAAADRSLIDRLAGRVAKLDEALKAVVADRAYQKLSGGKHFTSAPTEHEWKRDSAAHAWALAEAALTSPEPEATMIEQSEKDVEAAKRQLEHEVYETVIGDHRQMGGIAPIGRRAAAEVAQRAARTYAPPLIAAAYAAGLAAGRAEESGRISEQLHAKANRYKVGSESWARMHEAAEEVLEPSR